MTATTMHLLRRLRRFFGDDRGATAIEYALILAIMFLAIVGAIGGFAGTNGGAYDRTMEAAAEAMTGE